jgi:surface antigen
MKRIGIILIALGLAGCQMGDRDNKLALSTVGGLMLGGVAGYFGRNGDFFESITVAMMSGAAGALGGYYLADQLLPPDRQKLDSTAYNALTNAKTGQSIDWGEQQAGAWGTITPTRTFRGEDGSLCRDYRATIHLGDRAGDIEETACRLDDGAWRTI